jgi:hypothetical protein
MWVIARNGRKRPMLVHELDSSNTDYTMCGVLLVGWNREYLRNRPSGPVAILLCKRCSRIK